MRETEYHRVEGVGKQVGPNNNRAFDPTIYERAIHGLQRMILDGIRIDDDRYEDDYSAAHEETTKDDEAVIIVQEDTTLHSVCRIIPRNWDVSILTDLQFENSYAVRTSVDCGGGVLVFATFYVQDGMLRKFNVGHTDLADDEETIRIGDLGVNSSSREIMHLNRYLEVTVMQAYAKTIESAATAFDFIATKEDIDPDGSMNHARRNQRESVYQKDWAQVRGKTPQTVSNNVNSARDTLYNLPDSPAFDSTGPSLIELDPDADDSGDIRLV